MTNAGVDYHDATIYPSDAALLSGPHWINDHIITLAFEYLAHEVYNQDPVSAASAAPAVSSATLPPCFVHPGAAAFLIHGDDEDVADIAGGLDLTARDAVFIPLTDHAASEASGGSHWTLLAYARWGDGGRGGGGGGGGSEWDDRKGGKGGGAGTGTGSGGGGGGAHSASGGGADGGNGGGVAVEAAGASASSASSASSTAPSTSPAPSGGTWGFRFYDSGRREGSLSSAARAVARKLAPHMKGGAAGGLAVAREAPTQENGYDCGVYVVAMAEFLAAGIATDGGGGGGEGGGARDGGMAAVVTAEHVRDKRSVLHDQALKVLAGDKTLAPSVVAGGAGGGGGIGIGSGSGSGCGGGGDGDGGGGGDGSDGGKRSCTGGGIGSGRVAGEGGGEGKERWYEKG